MYYFIQFQQFYSEFSLTKFVVFIIYFENPSDDFFWLQTAICRASTILRSQNKINGRVYKRLHLRKMAKWKKQDAKAAAKKDTKPPKEKKPKEEKPKKKAAKVPKSDGKAAGTTVPKKTAAKKDGPKKTVTMKAGAKKVGPKKSILKKAAPKKDASKKAAPKKDSGKPASQ